ncbi:MAG: hypothetical protein JSR67_00070 [Proteobacteria bacterium]|nr:hypothetical protein [Pseudomonadota bacterium]
MMTTASGTASDAQEEDAATRRRLRVELLLAVSALLLGLLVVPLCIWLVGGRVLGPYTHGQDTHAGPLALLGDFFRGLGTGVPVFWGVALGPLLLLLLLRGFVLLYRALPGRQRA